MRTGAYLYELNPINAPSYWSYEKNKIKCWNHTEVGFKTKVPHVLNTLIFDDPVKFWKKKKKKWPA